MTTPSNTGWRADPPRRDGARTTPAETVRVIVPPTPPEFGPAAARALIRLVIAVHSKRAPNSDHPGEET
jgi:hypothetical protein